MAVGILSGQKEQEMGEEVNGSKDTHGLFSNFVGKAVDNR